MSDHDARRLRLAAIALLAISCCMASIWSLATRAPRTDERPAPRLVPGRSPPEIRLRIDVNRATADEFRLLPGIGPKLAGRIVDDREANGPFGTIEALGRVKGIGARTIERIRPLIEASPPEG